jgi:hypothetical protein
MLNDINDSNYDIRDRIINSKNESKNIDLDDKPETIVTYKKYNCIDCNKKLKSNFYYIGGNINGLTCCNIRVEKKDYSWMQYYYKESSEYFIVEICNTI